MIAGINCGFGDLLPADLLAELQTRFEALRVQLYKCDHEANPTLCTPEESHAIVQQVLEAGLRPYVLIRDPEQVHHVPHGVALDIELGNEPDLEQFGFTPDSYEWLVDAALAIQQAHYPELTLWAGVVSNLNPRGFRFLGNLPWSRWPSAVVQCAYHRYPHDDRGPTISHFAGKTRLWEVAQLRRMVGPRELTCSEVGYNELDFPEPVAAEHFGWERQFLKDTGHVYGLAYQVNDGPQTDDTAYGHYGFKDVETGRWKAQTDTWTGRA